MGEQFWVDMTFNAIKAFGHEDAVITDVRFDNEGKRILAEGGTLINVTRDGCAGDNHVSESGVDFNLVDFHLCNNGTIADLHDEIEGALGELNA